MSVTPDPPHRFRQVGALTCVESLLEQFVGCQQIVAPGRPHGLHPSQGPFVPGSDGALSQALALWVVPSASAPWP